MPRMSVDQVAAFSDKCIDACERWLLALNDKREPPPLLYHFTDLVGLVGILDSRALRFSLVTALNDCSEIDHGIELANDVINKRHGNQTGDFLDRTMASRSGRTAMCGLPDWAPTRSLGSRPEDWLPNIRFLPRTAIPVASLSEQTEMSGLRSPSAARSAASRLDRDFAWRAKKDCGFG
jgi:hypothetical protein